MNSETHVRSGSIPDSVLWREELGLGIKAVGFLLLAFNCIIVVFIWIGLRSGSALWLWWAIIEGILGFALFGLGTWLGRTATGEIGHIHTEYRLEFSGEQPGEPPLPNPPQH